MSLALNRNRWFNSPCICLFVALYRPLEEGEKPGKPEKRKRVFKILAKQKSFFVRAPTLELKDQWMQAIQEAARYSTILYY